MTDLSKEQRVERFLRELADLTRAYRISIMGCGCCGSPWLDTEADTWNILSHYQVDDEDSNLKWVPGGEQK